jgi:glycosyltransferase involved in cell wall biosynthesis
LSFSNIRQDARVLRHIEYLTPDYDLTVIGEGDPPANYPELRWERVDRRERLSGAARLLERVSTAALALLGKLLPRAYDLWYFTRPAYNRLYQAALKSKADAFLANDWETLPAAASAAAQMNAKLIFDAHEFAPLEIEESKSWLFWSSPTIRYLLRRYAPRAHGAVTVCQPIADRFASEYSFSPIVVMNAPKPVTTKIYPPSSDTIRLIHHGSAAASRRLDWIIEAVALAEPRFELHFYLVGSESEIQVLQKLAKNRLADRAYFHEPVAPQDILETIAAYDLGLCVIPPSNYSYLVSLPNKFFDYINARLGVLIGSSPAMKALVDAYGFGVVTSKFTPESIAQTLNALTPDRIATMKQAADAAAQMLNADIEMAKMTALFHRVLG